MQMPDVSYDYYLNTFNCGKDPKLSGTDFEFYCRRASEEVALRINKSAVTRPTDALRLAICNVAELIFSHTAAESIKSENIDGYSVTYKDSAHTSTSIGAVVEKHLADSGLLYRGV